MSGLVNPDDLVIGECQHVNAGVPDHFESDCVRGCHFWREPADRDSGTLLPPGSQPEHGASNFGNWDFACFNPDCRTTVFRGVLDGHSTCPGCDGPGVAT